MFIFFYYHYYSSWFECVGIVKLEDRNERCGTRTLASYKLNLPLSPIQIRRRQAHYHVVYVQRSIDYLCDLEGYHCKQAKSRVRFLWFYVYSKFYANIFIWYKTLTFQSWDYSLEFWWGWSCYRLHILIKTWWQHWIDQFLISYIYVHLKLLIYILGLLRRYGYQISSKTTTRKYFN